MSLQSFSASCSGSGRMRTTPTPGDGALGLGDGQSFRQEHQGEYRCGWVAENGEGLFEALLIPLQSRKRSEWIDASPDRLFDFVTDQANLPRWSPAVLLDGPGQPVGVFHRQLNPPRGDTIAHGVQFRDLTLEGFVQVVFCLVVKREYDRIHRCHGFRSTGEDVCQV